MLPVVNHTTPTTLNILKAQITLLLNHINVTITGSGATNVMPFWIDDKIDLNQNQGL